MSQNPVVPIGTPIRVTGGLFFGCSGKVLSKEDCAESKTGMLPLPASNSYLLLLNLDGNDFEAYLNRQEFEVISNCTT